MRDGLEIALGGRNAERLIPILEFLIFSITHPHLSKIAMHVSAIIIDIYSNIIGMNENIDNLFVILNQTINDFITQNKILLKLQGNIDCILSLQDIRANTNDNIFRNSNNKQNQENTLFHNFQSHVQQILDAQKQNAIQNS